MRTKRLGQLFYVDGYRYSQLDTANHVLILLRLGSGCRHLTEIAFHYRRHPTLSHLVIAKRVLEN